jgi:hypothetical protein
MQVIDMNIDLRAIPQLSYEELRAYYDKLIAIPTTSTRKEYYVWRITHKLQEMRFGGLDNKTRQMLENMDIKELAKPHKFVTGTEIVKQYKGATYKIRVTDGGFEMDGEVYKSLGSLAKLITGRKVSGQEFFGVKSWVK